MLEVGRAASAEDEGEETMCRFCECNAAGRRDFLKFGVAGLAAITLAGAVRPAARPKTRRRHFRRTKRWPRSNPAMSAM